VYIDLQDHISKTYQCKISINGGKLQFDGNNNEKACIEAKKILFKLEQYSFPETWKNVIDNHYLNKQLLRDPVQVGTEEYKKV